MAEELLQQIDQVDDPKLKIILQNLTKLLKEKDERIVTLENKVTDLEIRMSEQERYSSKDCLIVYNPPVTNEGNLWVEMAAFFSSYLDYECTPDLFKACHPLGNFNTAKKKTVIVKFLYFHDKNEIYSRRALLSNRLNRLNREPIFINERLPKHDVELKRHAESLGLVTTTRNCQVRIFHRAENGNVKTFPVNTVAGVNKWAATAIKRKPKGPLETPAPSSKKIESVLKRLREESTDEKNNELIDQALSEINSPNLKRVNSALSPCNDVQR